LDLNEKTIANMLKDAGYDTYALGKWQLDNGDLAMKTFGFKNYIIFEAFQGGGNNNDNDPFTKGRYKSPELYTNGKYLPKGTAVGKYCDDILIDSLTAYAGRSKSKSKPFFAYYAMSLCHSPFTPTPDDPEYPSYDPVKQNINDTAYFPSMVAYMDKCVGRVVHRIDSMGLSKNTMIFFVGDNGTPPQIFSYYKGDLIQGGKQKTTVWGTHVPLIAYWPGTITPGSETSILTDFTDFLPTIAGIASIPKPTTYGTLDGMSFYWKLVGEKGTPRSWVFCHYKPDHDKVKPLKRWIDNKTFKLYDSSGKFYNIVADPYEKKPVANKDLTESEKELRANFQAIMDTLH
jgi:arylsulfatase A